MKTELIGIKEFRQNIASYTSKAKENGITYIVLRKNVPVLEVKSINEKDFALEKLSNEISEARQQVKEGKIIDQKEIMEEFGIL